MVRVKSVAEYVQNYVRKSLMAFLEGEQNLNWIKGVIENSGILKMEGELERIFDRLKDYVIVSNMKPFSENASKEDGYSSTIFLDDLR